MDPIAAIPEERIREGHGVQLVNAVDADGTYVRQVGFTGTEEEARRYARMVTGQLAPSHVTAADWPARNAEAHRRRHYGRP